MNIIYFVPNITIAGGIFRIVSDKMNYLAENMEGRLFLAYYGNGQEKRVSGFSWLVSFLLSV